MFHRLIFVCFLLFLFLLFASHGLPTLGSLPFYPPHDSAVSSLERGSPLPEGRSRSLRSSRPYGVSSVTVVKMTPLSFLPGTRIDKYLGIINMFFIRETTSLREVRGRKPGPRSSLVFIPRWFLTFTCVCVFSHQEGGVSGFLHSFIAEVFAMVRAHVAALGGNAVVSYSMKECVFMENPNKNQVRKSRTTTTTKKNKQINFATQSTIKEDYDPNKKKR